MAEGRHRETGCTLFGCATSQSNWPSPCGSGPGGRERRPRGTDDYQISPAGQRRRAGRKSPEPHKARGQSRDRQAPVKRSGSRPKPSAASSAPRSIQLRPHRLAALLRDELSGPTSPETADEEQRLILSIPAQLLRVGFGTKMLIDETASPGRAARPDSRSP